MGRGRDNRRISARGFTLVETVVTMVVLSIIMVMVSRLFLTASMGYTSAAMRGELHTELSCALDRIITEVRSAPVKSGSSPACADITSVTPSSIAWFDADGKSRTVTLSGTNLLYSESGGAGAVLATGVSSFSVSTFDESNVGLASSLSGSGTAAIRRVQISLVATRGGVTETLRTRVFPLACMAK